MSGVPVSTTIQARHVLRPPSCRLPVDRLMRRIAGRAVRIRL
jgi:hypothetical protein